MARSKTSGRLSGVAREVDELERGRATLLARVEKLRDELKAIAGRTAALKASAEMLGDHAATTAAAVAELRAIEDEARELGVSVLRMNSDSLGLIFEAESLKETLSEVEDEMDRLLSSFIEGRGKKLRGH
jgi:chromosome segregation ATPase